MPLLDNPKKFWQMPQGGVDKNEKLFEAAKGELEEETGIKSIKLKLVNCLNKQKKIQLIVKLQIKINT